MICMIALSVVRRTPFSSKDAMASAKLLVAYIMIQSNMFSYLTGRNQKPVVLAERFIF